VCLRVYYKYFVCGTAWEVSRSRLWEPAVLFLRVLLEAIVLGLSGVLRKEISPR